MSLIENYGVPDLNWGTYPIDISLDSGGGCSNCPLKEASDNEKHRVACNMKRAVERGGNNPYDFQACPKNDTVYGTGCMNPGCMCKNCQGDCVCSHLGGGEVREGFVDYFANRDIKFWLGLVGVAFLAYYVVKERPFKKMFKCSKK